jgi:hypothetical protein
MYVCMCVCVCVYVCVSVRVLGCMGACVCVQISLIIQMVALRQEQIVITTGPCNGNNCFSPRSVSFVFVLYSFCLGMFALVSVCC